MSNPSGNCNFQNGRKSTRVDRHRACACGPRLLGIDMLGFELCASIPAPYPESTQARPNDSTPPQPCLGHNTCWLSTGEMLKLSNEASAPPSLAP